MTVFVDDPDFQLHVGDAIDVLRTLPDESVHCVVTSPPYWGLRDYGTGTWAGGDADCQHRVVGQVQDTKAKGAITAGVRLGVDASTCLDCGATRTDQQVGLEPTPEAYVARMVDVFREVRRVLRRDGTCWLNIGDSYATTSGITTPTFNVGNLRDGRGSQQQGPKPSGITKAKDLVGIPWRLAFALQADGWYLRSDIIWSKPNPMPESVTDRPTKSHEYLFLLTRSARYFYDADAIREAYTYGNDGRLAFTGQTGDNGRRGASAKGPDGRRVSAVIGKDGSEQHRNGERWPNPSGRNARSVWEIATQPYAEAHFATFPEELPRRCIAAGTSERGCCPECGAPWERVTEVQKMSEVCVTSDGPKRRGRQDQGLQSDKSGLSPSRVTGMPTSPIIETTGWRSTCDHGLEPTACVVLDPFMGSGTVALVARKLGRRSIGIELNPEYAELAARRLQQQSLFA